MSVYAAIAGGYTAGHLTPGFAIIDALRAADSSRECLFIGSEIGPERKVIEARGLTFCSISSLPYSRGDGMDKFRSLFAIPRSIVQSIRLLRRQRVQRLMVLGGHASVGPGLAARILGIPVFILEPNASFGKANRLLARVARTIFTSPLFNEPVSEILSRRIVCSGVPLRAELRRIASKHDAKQASRSGLRNLLILGGSLGHDDVNLNMPGVCGALIKEGFEMRVVHQCGVQRVQSDLDHAYRMNDVEAHVVSYIDDIAEQYDLADVIVSAAGAISLAELSMVGKPAVIVPLKDAAGQHQLENAIQFETFTGAPVVVHSDKMANDLTSALTQSLTSPAGGNKDERSMTRFWSPDAHAVIVSHLEKVGESHD